MDNTDTTEFHANAQKILDIAAPSYMKVSDFEHVYQTLYGKNLRDFLPNYDDPARKGEHLRSIPHSKFACVGYGLFMSSDVRDPSENEQRILTADDVLKLFSTPKDSASALDRLKKLQAAKKQDSQC